nr:sulfatase-like hydrolase/transferase [Sphingosinicella sp. CPCC 101087]
MLALDSAVARILAALDARSMTQRTLMIFTSDNGGKQYSNMAGLTRGKGHVWEGGIRVPAFVRWPNILPAGVTSAQVATTLDWTATMLAVAGAAPPAALPLDGTDLLPHLAAGVLRDRTIFWRMGRARQGAVRRGIWKYLRDGEDEHLFDLSLDPGERRDLKSERRDRFEELRAAYADWDKQMLPPLERSGS